MTSADIAVVTGANRGIGREVARLLAAEGMVVYLGARDHERGRAAARELSSGGADVRFVQFDVTDQSQIDAVAREIGKKFGRIDVLVNNAGIGGSRPKVEETTAHDFTAVMDVNLLGAVRTTRALLPLMHKAEHPRIVNGPAAEDHSRSTRTRGAWSHDCRDWSIPYQRRPSIC